LNISQSVSTGIYKHYASSAGAASGTGDALSFHELCALAKDCKVFSSKITKGVLKSIFTKSKLSLAQVPISFFDLFSDLQKTNKTFFDEITVQNLKRTCFYRWPKRVRG
jgi:hypothetical protein